MIGRAIRTQTRARPRARRAGGARPPPARAGGGERGRVRARPGRARPPRRARPQPERDGHPGLRRARRALEPPTPARRSTPRELIERTGREALVELRRLFGPVRRGEGEALEGSPGLDSVEAPDRARSRRAGLPADAAGRGGARSSSAPAPTWPPTGSCRRRSRTRSSTPAPATTEVRVRYRPDGLSIE